MKGATSIQERLWELRKDKGLNLEELSKLTGISKSALGSYEKEDFKEINHGNLITLADFYGVSVDYLLCRTENREQINTPLTELHLNDEMVALLKSGRINNRLLCELATHKDFIKFLADIEIYVDGIATMQIQNLNTLVDTVRHEIIERYRPGEDDPHLKVLQAAHISDDEYFSHMVLDDLNLIIRDIRETHKKDSESAPQTTVANELKENLEAIENFKGSRDEKLVVLFMGFPNIPDNEIEVIQNHVAEIFIITDMGSLQHFQMRVIFAWAIPFNDFMPDGIDKGVEVLNLHGGNPVHINLNICKKLDKIFMCSKLTEQTVVNPTAFQQCHHLIIQMQLRKDKGLNLEELSKLTGISKSALGSYEKEDYKEINHGNLITLADFYGVSVDYLLCRTVSTRALRL